MQQEKKLPEQIPVDLVGMTAPDVIEYYANIGAVGTTADDVVLAFGRALPGLEVTEGRGEVSVGLRVILPPRVAASLAETILQTITLRYGKGAGTPPAPNEHPGGKE